MLIIVAPVILDMYDGDEVVESKEVLIDLVVEQITYYHEEKADTTRVCFTGGNEVTVRIPVKEFRELLSLKDETIKFKGYNKKEANNE